MCLVLQDVASNLLKPELVNEMINASTTMPLSSFKALFDKIVHSSIMKLNATSMDKVPFPPPLLLLIIIIVVMMMMMLLLLLLLLLLLDQRLETAV